MVGERRQRAAQDRNQYTAMREPRTAHVRMAAAFVWEAHQLLRRHSMLNPPSSPIVGGSPSQGRAEQLGFSLGKLRAELGCCRRLPRPRRLGPLCARGGLFVWVCDPG